MYLLGNIVFFMRVYQKPYSDFLVGKAKYKCFLYLNKYINL